MTLTHWRTTKIPEYYFNEIEQVLAVSQRYVSVSEFIRQAIEEKLSVANITTKESRDFLLLKDLVFTESRIKQVHQFISMQFPMDSTELLKEDIRKVIDQSLDVEMITFLSKFMYHFAKYHPFKDGNKRTVLITVDTFLRLNNLKLNLKAQKDKETEEELFFWQNSTQQKNIEQIKQFLKKHIEKYIPTQDVEKEIIKSISDNRLLLEKLAR